MTEQGYPTPTAEDEAELRARIEAVHEREREATRAAEFVISQGGEHPLAVVYIASQAVTVSVEDGALHVDVLIAEEDERGVFDPGDCIPISFGVEGSPVLTINQHGVALAHGFVREQLDAEE